MMHHRIRKIRNVRRSRRFQWLNRFRRNEQGVSLIETAIIVPILLVLFAGVAEFGRYFYEYSTLAKASRVGARYLASKSVTSNVADYKGIAKNIIVYGNAAGSGSPILDGLTTDNVEVTYDGGPAGVPDTVTVKIIDYPHVPLFDLGALLNIDDLSLAVNVAPSVTMRYLLTQPTV
jgi:Flp pilus assembly protein TadG